jgi:23S rRNA (guanosine2251-2'-O)-methyltransferase
MKNINRKVKSNIIFGIHPVAEALNARRELEKVFIQKGLTHEKIRDILNECNSLKIPVQKVPIEKLNRITRKNHQGIIAFQASITYASLENIIDSTFQKGKDPLLLVLDRITDVRNFGAIARTAEGLGFDLIIIPETGSARINEDAIRTSAGALHHIPVTRVKDLKNTLDFLSVSGIRVIASTEKTDNNLSNTDLTGPLALVMGSEDVGIDGKLLERAHHKVRIPMYGKIESFNVSVSFGIIGYEILRQRTN